MFLEEALVMGDTVDSVDIASEKFPLAGAQPEDLGQCELRQCMLRVLG